jgi:hypothetical protein
MSLFVIGDIHGRIDEYLKRWRVLGNSKILVCRRRDVGLGSERDERPEIVMSNTAPSEGAK